MLNTKKTKSIHELSTGKQILFGLFVFIFIAIVFFVFPINARDWRFTFYPASRIPLQPYSIKTFINPPWITIPLFPVRYFSEDISVAINASISFIIITILVLKKKGDLFSVVLTLTSLPFFLILVTGAVEWVPALGFIFQSGWGLPLLMTKPQSGILAGLSWFLNSKKKYLFIAPSMLVVISSFFIWGNWIGKILENVRYMDEEKIGLYTVNFSPFPWSIPIGLGLIFYIIRKKPDNGEILGTIATYCLVPYFYPHSLIIPFALLSASYRRLTILLWVLLWLYPIVQGWTEIMKALGFN